MTFAVANPNTIGQWLPLVGFGAALGALTVLDGPVLCPYRRCTGGYCALCGATRSVASLARLDPVGAFRLYPALPLVMFAVVVAIRPTWLGQARSDRLLLALAGFVTIIWLVRLTLGDVPAPTHLQWPVSIS